ncbi:MAG: recombinase family protein [Clostridia bacterium]|nr:recombinase family protein [Clostridia bacterium]
MIEKFDIAGYCRISVDDELDRDNTSIENQKSIIRDYVSRNFPGSSLTFYEDRDRSGYTFEQREGYQSLRPNLMRGNYDILIVKDFSRFSRRNSRGLVELEDLRDAGVRIISIGDSIDYPTYDDWTAIQFRFLVNEMPVTDASKKVRSVIKRRQEDGKWICAVPYGYVITNTKTMAFEVEPNAAKVIKKVYDLYLDGWGYKRIANYLTEQRIPTPRMDEKARKEARGEECKIKCKPEWSLVTIQGILTNDFYTGVLWQGKYTRKNINGADLKKDDSDHIVFENNHEAIIDSATFSKAQQLMQKRTTSHYRGVKKYDNIYSGLMRCGDCGSPMFSMSRGDLKEAYHCGKYHTRGLKGCTSHHIHVELLNELFKDYVQQVKIVSMDMVTRIQKAIADESEKAETKKENPTVTLQKKLDDCIEERKILMRQCAREIMRHSEREESIQETYDELILEIDNKIEGLRNQLALCDERDDTVAKVSKIAKTTFDICDEFLTKEKLDKCDLEFIIKGINVYEDHLEIELKDDIQCILQCDPEEELNQVVNFNSGIVDSLQTQVVQRSKHQKDKVYDVNVISKGDPLEIFTASDGEVIFKKYSPIGEVSNTAKQYAEVLNRSTELPVLIFDRDHVISCAGIPKKEVLDRRVSPELEEIMENRSNFSEKDSSHKLIPAEGIDRTAAVAYPIIGSGDVLGAVVLLSSEDNRTITETDTKLIQVAASFLGKQMEE